MRLYAGIGSRQTPLLVLDEMTEVASELARAGWVLRSGHAHGADQAFEAGVHGVDPSLMEIWVPKVGFNRSSSTNTPTLEAYSIAAIFHPAWYRCDEFAQAAHARNCHILLGRDLATPVRFVLCWTPGGKGGGGTGQGIRVARDYGIPVVDMAIVGWREKLVEVSAAGVEPARD